jgi:hypothetical protein
VKFRGATAVGELVVFAPANADVVGIYNTQTGTFNRVSTGSLTMNNKFMGAAAVGELAVFAPFNADVVGIYNTQTGTFDASLSTGSLKMDSKFVGVAAVGELVVFAPYNAGVVGICNTQTRTFDATVTTGTLAMNAKFRGAAAVGDLVVFAPWNADVVGTFLGMLDLVGTHSTLSSFFLGSLFLRFVSFYLVVDSFFRFRHHSVPFPRGFPSTLSLFRLSFCLGLLLCGFFFWFFSRVDYLFLPSIRFLLVIFYSVYLYLSFVLSPSVGGLPSVVPFDRDLPLFCFLKSISALAHKKQSTPGSLKRSLQATSLTCHHPLSLGCGAGSFMANGTWTFSS